MYITYKCILIWTLVSDSWEFKTEKIVNMGDTPDCITHAAEIYERNIHTTRTYYMDDWGIKWRQEGYQWVSEPFPIDTIGGPLFTFNPNSALDQHTVDCLNATIRYQCNIPILTNEPYTYPSMSKYAELHKSCTKLHCRCRTHNSSFIHIRTTPKQ